jgi:hypothetical protein
LAISRCFLGVFSTCFSGVVDSEQDRSSTDLSTPKHPVATGTSVQFEICNFCTGSATSEDMDESAVGLVIAPFGQHGESVVCELVAQRDDDARRFEVSVGCTFLEGSGRLHEIGLGALLTCNKILHINYK